MPSAARDALRWRLPAPARIASCREAVARGTCPMSPTSAWACSRPHSIARR